METSPASAWPLIRRFQASWHSWTISVAYFCAMGRQYNQGKISAQS